MKRLFANAEGFEPPTVPIKNRGLYPAELCIRFLISVSLHHKI